MTERSRSLAVKWLAAKPRSTAQLRMQAEALAWLAETTVAESSPSGCVPGQCKCPPRYSMCRMWTTLTRKVREKYGIPEPERRVINKYGQDVTGRVYPSKSAALHDIHGSLCE